MGIETIVADLLGNLNKRILTLPESVRYWGIKASSMAASYIPGTLAAGYFASHEYSNIENAVYSALVKAAVFIATDIPLQIKFMPEKYLGRQTKGMFLTNIIVSDIIGAIINGGIGIYGHYESLQGAADKVLQKALNTSFEDIGIGLKNSPRIAFIISHGVATVIGTGCMYFVEKTEVLRKSINYFRNRS